MNDSFTTFVSPKQAGGTAVGQTSRSKDYCSDTVPMTRTLYSSILLFGPPGCGKGTVGKALGELPRFVHCSSGDLIRSAMSEKGGHGKRWSAVANGGLLADEDLWELFDAYLSSVASNKLSTPETRLLVIDGIPRCRSQVGELAKRVAIQNVFCLDCRNPEILIERILRRSAQESRIDDSSKRVVQGRLKLYAEETLPLLDEYPSALVHRIDASQTPVRVLAEVLAQLHLHSEEY